MIQLCIGDVELDDFLRLSEGFTSQSQEHAESDVRDNSIHAREREFILHHGTERSTICVREITSCSSSVK